MRHWIKAALAVGLAFLPGIAAAQESTGPLSASLAVERVEIDQETNKEVMKPADTASPGDLLQYTARYTNVSEEPLSGLVVNGPVPANTVFLKEGLAISQEASLEVLIAGEPWQGVPAFKTVTLEDGTKKRVPAEPADYREIRWRLADPLAPKATLVAIYRVRVKE